MNIAARNYFLISQSLIQKPIIIITNTPFLEIEYKLQKMSLLNKRFSPYSKMLPNTEFHKGVFYTFTQIQPLI